MTHSEQQYPITVSIFNNGSGEVQDYGQWMSEDEARELWEDAAEPFPPFTGEEFCARHESIDSHPYATAFGQFLGNGIDADTANQLAFGIHSAIANISDDYTDSLRVKAVNIFDRFSDMGYWADSEDLERQPEDFSWGNE